VSKKYETQALYHHENKKRLITPKIKAVRIIQSFSFFLPGFSNAWLSSAKKIIARDELIKNP